MFSGLGYVLVKWGTPEMVQTLTKWDMMLVADNGVKISIPDAALEHCGSFSIFVANHTIIDRAGFSAEGFEKTITCGTDR